MPFNHSLLKFLQGDYSLSGALAEQSQHTDFGSNKSDSKAHYKYHLHFDKFLYLKCSIVSAASLTESDRRALAPDLRSSITYSSHLGGVSAHTPRPHSQQGLRTAPISAASHHVPPFRAHTHLRRSLPNMSAATLAAHQVLI